METTLKIRKPRKIGTKVPKLTPTLKRVFVTAIDLLSQEGMWIQNEYMLGRYPDDDEEQEFGDGFENGKVQVTGLCAVGGLQRAAWIVSGKPDMSTQKIRKQVDNLAKQAEKRADYFAQSVLKIDDYGGEDVEEYKAHNMVAVNDDFVDSVEPVIQVLKNAANL